MKDVISLSPHDFINICRFMSIGSNEIPYKEFVLRYDQYQVDIPTSPKTIEEYLRYFRGCITGNNNE